MGKVSSYWTQQKGSVKDEDGGELDLKRKKHLYSSGFPVQAFLQVS